MATIPQAPTSGTNYEITGIVNGWQTVPLYINVKQSPQLGRMVTNLSGDAGHMIESQKNAINRCVLLLKQGQEYYEQAMNSLVDRNITFTVKPLEWIPNPDGSFGEIHNPEYSE